jgi:hypothetical protein
MFKVETNKTWSVLGDLPWWQRGLLLAGFIVLMSLIFVWMFFVVVFFTLASVVSWLLPFSWRRVACKKSVTATSDVIECPWCGSMIEAGPVMERGQQGVCSGCGRAVRRCFQTTAIGYSWSPWQAAEGTTRLAGRLSQ